MEEAGAGYDSTIATMKRWAIFRRATQVYQTTRKATPRTCCDAMDTALFYPDHLGLSPRQAKEITQQLRDNAVGSEVTINWHDRSLGTREMWGECYRSVIKDLRNEDAWISTAGAAGRLVPQTSTATFEKDYTRGASANHGPRYSSQWSPWLAIAMSIRRGK